MSHVSLAPSPPLVCPVLICACHGIVSTARGSGFLLSLMRCYVICGEPFPPSSVCNALYIHLSLPTPPPGLVRARIPLRGGETSIWTEAGRVVSHLTSSLFSARVPCVDLCACGIVSPKQAIAFLLSLTQCLGSCGEPFLSSSACNALLYISLSLSFSLSHSTPPPPPSSHPVAVLSPMFSFLSLSLFLSPF